MAIFKKKWMRFLLGFIVVLVLAYVGFLQYMKRQDKTHARFASVGKTILSFIGDYAKDLQEAAETGDLDKVMTYYADNYASPNRGHWAPQPPEMHGGTMVTHYKAEAAPAFDKERLRAEMAEYLATFGKLKKIGCKIDLIEETEFGKSAVLTVKYFVLGYDPEGNKLEDRFFFRWWLENPSGDEEFYEWKVVKDELVQGVRVTGPATAFTEMDLAELGIDYTHHRDPKLNKDQHGESLRFDMMEHAFGGAASGDFDNDGRDDLLFCDGVESKLYRNITETDGPIRFEDRTELIGKVGAATSALFFDYDNDGDQDLFMARYEEPCLFFENQGESGFQEKAAAVGLNLVAPISSILNIDYDKDGRLDIFFAVYGNAMETFPEIPMHATNAEPNRLFRNTENGFVDVTEQAGVGYTGWALACAAGDINLDGYTDIMVANDFGRKELLRNNGDGTFTDIAHPAGVIDFSGGMGVTIADISGDGIPDIYTSNIKSNQRWYGEDRTMVQFFHNQIRTKWFFVDFWSYYDLYNLVDGRWKELGKQTGEGNSLFYNNGDGTFRELKNSNTNQAGWGWSVAAIDYDNDTDLDLYAMNGWVSQTPGPDL